jgi:hypothetical protein
MNGQVMSEAAEEGETMEARETALSSFRGQPILEPEEETGISRTFGRVPEAVLPEKRASRTGESPARGGKARNARRNGRRKTLDSCGFLCENHRTLNL